MKLCPLCDEFVPIHCQRCKTENCDHVFKLNKQPKKQKLPNLGEAMYALDKINTTNGVEIGLVKCKFYGISLKKNTVMENPNTKQSKSKEPQKQILDNSATDKDSEEIDDNEFMKSVSPFALN